MVASRVRAAFDGGFASKEDLREIKELGVQDVSFSKKRGLDVRNLRAGIESC